MNLQRPLWISCWRVFIPAVFVAVLADRVYSLEPLPPNPSLKSSSAAPAAPKKSSSVELPVLSAPAPESAGGVEEYRAKASEYAAKGDWVSAELNLRSAIRLDPENADVVLELSKALAEQGKAEAALAVLVGYGGTDLRVSQSLAEAYVASERFMEAERVFMDLSLRQPAIAHHRYNLGLVESRMGKFDLAENAYLRSIELDPSFADARYNLALLYIRMKDYPKALAQLEEAVRLRTDVDYLINYAVVLREMNRIPSALAALEQALSLEPDNVLALNNLGMTHYVAGNKAEAQKAFTEVLNINPMDSTARSFLSKISLEPPASPRPSKEDQFSQTKSAPAGDKQIPEVQSRLPEKSNPTPSMQSKPAVQEVQSDLARLQKENKDLREQMAFLEARMEDVSRGMSQKMMPDEKVSSPKSASAPKKIPAVRESKEAEEKESNLKPAADDLRIEELQKNLADLRTELEVIRRDRGMPVFSPEPGSTDVRLDAADRAVEQLQRQIRQLVIERDLLRAEIRAMREPGGGMMPSMEFGHTNINLADLNALLLLPGMDERLAHNILWYRQNIGPFKSLLDLKNVPGMDEGHYAQLVDFVTLGPSTNQ